MNVLKFVCCFTLPLLASASFFFPKFEWNYYEYEYPSQEERTAAINNGSFVPLRATPIDVDVYHGPKKSKIFITFPNLMAGIPASVTTVSDKKLNGKHLVAPYPDWSWYQNVGSCPDKRIVSTYRVKVDECGRVWVLDNGRYQDVFTCPPQLLAFDANTNKLLVKYNIPPSFYKNSNPTYVTPIVDVRDSCEKAFVYIADCNAYNLIVYDVARKTSWKLKDKSMFPIPKFGTFSIEGESFELMDGILGMDLSPYIPGEDRKLHYHSLSGNTEHWVYTSDIQNQSAFHNNDPFALTTPQIFHEYTGKKLSQNAPTAISQDGIMYFGQASYTSIHCWNTEKEFEKENIQLIEYNKDTLQFNSGMKIIYNKKGEEELWLVTNRLQKRYTGTMSQNEINFRVLVAPLKYIPHCRGCAK